MRDELGPSDEPTWRRVVRWWWIVFGAIALVIAIRQDLSDSGLAAIALIALVVVMVGLLILTAFRYFERARAYPGVVAQLAELRRERESLIQDSDAQRAANRTALEDGVEEGMLRVVGAWLSSAVKTPPKIVATTMSGNDLYLVGETEESIRIGTRFVVEVVGSGERKGVVQVVSATGATPVRMRCVEQTSPEFWKAASLDVMSNGRFELGIGAGAFWDAVAGMGGPRRTNAEAFDALTEAIPIIRAALDVGPERRVVRGPGPHYPVGYPAGPPPAHRVEIWVGAYRRRGLELIGRMADGWVPSVGNLRPEGLRKASARIDEAALAAGRDPSAIRRIYNIGPFGGPDEEWVEMLATWVTELGVDAFVYWPGDTGTDGIQRFATEVAPAVRSALRGK